MHAKGILRGAPALYAHNVQLQWRPRAEENTNREEC
jgi:hypothetical protein